MKKILQCLGTTILLSSASHAAVIGVGDAFTGGGVEEGLITDVFQFALGRDNDHSTDIFDQILLRTSDSGRTFTLTSAEDPEFDNLVRVLTNGVDEVILNYACFPYPSFCFGSGTNESALFGNPGINGIDFQGFAITSISLRLDELTVDHSGGGTSVTIHGATIIEGHRLIPEPSSLTLMGLGIATLFAYGWRRRSFRSD